MMIQLALALAATAPAQDDVARGSIRGTIQSEPSGLPVQMAVVEVETAAGTFRAVAEPSGAYLLHRVPAGRGTVRVRHLEHHPREFEVLVPAGNEVVLEIILEHRPITLPQVRVVALSGIGDTVAASRPDLAVIDVRAIENAGAPPGVVSPVPPGGGEGGSEDEFYVRGSAADLQLVLLDGAPVYAPFHLGGLIDSFDPGVLGSARLYLGGAPARFDGGLAYVMDLTTRTPNRERHAASGAVDMLAGRAMVEGPLPGGAGYLLSGRGVHGAALTGIDGAAFPYTYRDGLLRLQAPLPDGASLSVTAFANREGMRVDTAGAPHRRASSRNTAGSARFRSRVEGADVEVTLAFGRYGTFRPLAHEQRRFLFGGGVDRLRMGADFARAVGPVKLRYGASHDRTWVTHEGTEVGEDSWSMHERAVGAITGGYLEGTWQPDRALVLRGGLRADLFSVETTIVGAPRLSATWLISDRAALTLAGGRYHQFVRVTGPRRNLPTSGGDTVGVPRVPTDMALAGATHMSVALDQELVDGLRLGLEGYYKHFFGLPSRVNGNAYSSGMDVWVRQNGEAMSGWFGYSLGWYWALPGAEGGSYRVAGRQLISAGASGPVHDLGMLGVRLAYGSGLPGGLFTSLDAAQGEAALRGSPGSLFTERMDLGSEAPLAEFDAGPYLRLDAEVSRTWNPRLGGRATTFTPYLRIVNALDRRDALYYGQEQQAAAAPGEEGVGTLPLVPVAGVSWTF
jgi:hypothetical protein